MHDLLDDDPAHADPGVFVDGMVLAPLLEQDGQCHEVKGDVHGHDRKTVQPQRHHVQTVNSRRQDGQHGQQNQALVDLGFTDVADGEGEQEAETDDRGDTEEDAVVRSPAYPAGTQDGDQRPHHDYRCGQGNAERAQAAVQRDIPHVDQQCLHHQQDHPARIHQAMEMHHWRRRRERACSHGIPVGHAEAAEDKERHQQDHAGIKRRFKGGCGAGICRNRSAHEFPRGSGLPSCYGLFWFVTAFLPNSISLQPAARPAPCPFADKLQTTVLSFQPLPGHAIWLPE